MHRRTCPRRETDGKPLLLGKVGRKGLHATMNRGRFVDQEFEYAASRPAAAIAALRAHLRILSCYRAGLFGANPLCSRTRPRAGRDLLGVTCWSPAAMSPRRSGRVTSRSAHRFRVDGPAALASVGQANCRYRPSGAGPCRLHAVSVSTVGGDRFRAVTLAGRRACSACGWIGGDSSRVRSIWATARSRRWSASSACQRRGGDGAIPSHRRVEPLGLRLAGS